MSLRIPASIGWLALLLPSLLSAATPRQPTPHAMPPDTRPLLIAHRGASALLPEHTLAAYRRAINDGADAIEPDLVMTRDGAMVVRHENGIGVTTDVADHPEFAARRTRKQIDGKWVEDWFTEDFTLAELQTLRMRERLPDLRSTRHDGLYAIATLEQIIALADQASAVLGRDIVVAPEIKHPGYFASIGLPMEHRLLGILDAHAYTRRAPIIIQSFEPDSLRTLRQHIGDRPNIRLLQLLARGATQTPEALRGIAGHADIIGPSVHALRSSATAEGGFRSSLVDDAHAAGLQVMPWTYRPENRFLPARHRRGADTDRNEAGSIRQIREDLMTGIDGLFADDPAVARRAIDEGQSPL